MKDTKARGRLNKIEAEFQEQVNCGLRDLRIEECPKCKHYTLNVKEDISGYGIYEITARSVQSLSGAKNVYTCLTCGTKWEKVAESTSRIIQDSTPKKKKKPKSS